MLKGEAKTERLKAAQINPTAFVLFIPWRNNIVPPNITPQNPKSKTTNNFIVNICNHEMRTLNFDLASYQFDSYTEFWKREKVAFSGL